MVDQTPPIPVTPVTTTAPVTATPEPVQATPAPVAAPAPAVLAASPAETVLGEAIQKTTQTSEAPKVEAKVEAKVEEKPKEGQSAEPAPPPVYDAFKVPEGVSLDQEGVKKFTGILSELEQGGKVDHTLVQQFGQKAVDFHIEEVKKATESVTKLYMDTWEKQKTDWKDTFLKDPEMGGSNTQATIDSALNFIRTHGGTPEQQAEFRNLMETSGLGNHPTMIRLLANAGRGMQEGKPLAASKPVPASKTRIETMYGKLA